MKASDSNRVLARLKGRLFIGHEWTRMNANKKALTLLLLGSALATRGAEPTWIDQYLEEAPATTKICKAKDYAACRDHLLHLDQLLDGRADIVYRLAKVEAALGNKDAALEKLTVFSKSGFTFADPGADPDFAPVRSNPEFEKALIRIKNAKQPQTASTLFLTLPEPDLIAEDIAYDSKQAKFYVSCVRHSKILAIDQHGARSEFVREGTPDVWAILAVGVDSKRRILWAATAALPEGLGYRKEDEGRSALLKYSLETGALLKRYDLKKSGETKPALGDLTISPTGDVFVSDGQGGPIYRVEHSKDALEILVDKGTFRSPQTPALTPDGRRLFVPDYSRGISIVDLATKQVKLLEHPKELSLGGIDGMYLSVRTLIAIQNGTDPERLIRMTLDESLTHVVEWKTIEANWPGLGDPTHGVVIGDEFYFIANSGWDRMADDGTVKPGATFEPATIRRMPLKAR